MRWLLVFLLACLLFNGLQHWLRKIGLGKLPGDFSFRMLINNPNIFGGHDPGRADRIRKRSVRHVEDDRIPRPKFVEVEERVGMRDAMPRKDDEGRCTDAGRSCQSRCFSQLIFLGGRNDQDSNV